MLEEVIKHDHLARTTTKKRGRSYSIMARVVIQIRMEKRKINSYTHTHTPLRVFIVGSYKEYRI